MLKNLIIPIQCGETICESEDDMCDYLCENFAGRYCDFFREVLKMDSDKTVRCKKCMEAQDD